MNSIIRAASRLASRRVLDGAVFKRPVVTPYNMTQPSKRWASNQVLTYDFVRERILLILRLFDKIDPEKVTLDSHFVRDLGLDSLDHVEIIMEIENDFNFEIPDKDAELLITPGHIVKYLTDKEECYEELQRLQAEAHHGHGDHGHDHHAAHGHTSAGNHHDNNSSHPQKRSFCSMTTMASRYMSSDDRIFATSFRSYPKKPVNFDEIQERVMKVCSKYDKIDSSKLDVASHFVQDLGLDSLDHVEIMMELEDEFGLEIPDKEAEKLMRPAEIARFIFQQEEKRSLQPEDRQL